MSGIYIPGMEMPVGGCVNCIFCVYDRCLINLKLEKKASVTHGCPLVPAPDIIQVDLGVFIEGKVKTFDMPNPKEASE